MTHDKLYTEPEAAQYLGFRARITLWRLRRRGKIAFYKIGARIFYAESHLREFLLRCERPARAARKEAV